MNTAQMWAFTLLGAVHISALFMGFFGTLHIRHKGRSEWGEKMSRRILLIIGTIWFVAVTISVCWFLSGVIRS